ncbi:MAG: multicopper oxidase domain-containing protein [Betaproteobacteria bacterium]|nr:multicopper oxidase domain-containing protein [Betaproteobacteria bacterium]
MKPSSRRKFMIAAGAGTAAGLAGGFWWWNRPRLEHAGLPPVRDPAFPNPLPLPGSDGMFGVLDVAGTVAIAAKSARHAMLPGKPARMLAYEVQHEGRKLLNPVLRVRAGATLRANLWNTLDEATIIHWHGLKVDANNDGHPHYAIAGGRTYDYQYTVLNRAATYWYHPHAHGTTGKQLYLGLASLFIVEDDEELALQRALDLRVGVSDIPLMIQDKDFDVSGTPAYAPDAEQRASGYFGREVLINLAPRPYFDAATRIYRFRILNGSNARIYRLAFRSGERLLDYRVIATDGGLLDRPYRTKEVFLSSGERVEVLLDLRAAREGDTVWLTSRAFDPMHQETGPGAHPGHGAAPDPQPQAGEHGMAHHGAAPAPQSAAQSGSLPDGAAVDLLRINVAAKVRYDRPVPATLAEIVPLDAKQGASRKFLLQREQGQWRINGLTFRMMETPIVVRRGATEIWEIRNSERSMPHPMHIHGFQFQMLSRSGSPEQQRQLAVNAQGLASADLGWKDTVLVWPGETVRLALDFTHPFNGDQVYLFHCHNLEHSDEGMMINIKVLA